MNKWLALAEQHVEKIVLGGCGVFLLLMVWWYLIQSPNTKEFGGEQLAPGQLYAAIADQAKRLSSAVRSAKPEEAKTEHFEDRFEREFDAGVFAAADGRAALDAEIPRATTYGDKIVVPGLEDMEEASGSIVLVKPLPPKGVVVETGRSMVYRTPLVLDEETAVTPPPADEAAKPVETPWVTVAGYFDRAAQYSEMVDADYAPYRARAYITGVDVQRQEMGADGVFGEWKDVQVTDAEPKITIPEPAIDDVDGSLANKEDIERTFQLVKARQPYLTQPPFYAVEAGDFWDTPQLEGYEHEDDADEESADDSDRFAGRATPPETSTPGGGMRGPATGGGGRSVGGGRTGFRGGTGGMGGGAQTSADDSKRQARKVISDTFKDIKTAFSQKDYMRVRDMANSITQNSEANSGDKKRAERYAEQAEREIQRQNNKLAGGASIDRRMLLAKVIEHPEKKSTPAVWFHDIAVESGKTYRYRIRVRLWNRYVGRMDAMKNREDAGKPEVVGEWSRPSEPITVAPASHFYVRGSRPTDGSATLDVWKWRDGSWIKQTFEVAVGDVIGGVRNVKTEDFDPETGKQVQADVDFSTGAVVLDLRFDEDVQQRLPGKDGAFSYRDQSTLIVVYLDPADGQVKEKSMLADRYDATRKALEEQEL